MKISFSQRILGTHRVHPLFSFVIAHICINFYSLWLLSFSWWCANGKTEKGVKRLACANICRTRCTMHPRKSRRYTRHNVQQATNGHAEFSALHKPIRRYYQFFFGESIVDILMTTTSKLLRVGNDQEIISIANKDQKFTPNQPALKIYGG